MTWLLRASLSFILLAGAGILLQISVDLFINGRSSVSTARFLILLAALVVLLCYSTLFNGGDSREC